MIENLLSILAVALLIFTMFFFGMLIGLKCNYKKIKKKEEKIKKYKSRIHELEVMMIDISNSIVDKKVNKKKLSKTLTNENL